MQKIDKERILIIDSYGSIMDVSHNQHTYQNSADYGVMMLHHSRIEKHILRVLFSWGFEQAIFRRSLNELGVNLGKYNLIIVNELGRDPLSFIRYIRKKNPYCHLIYKYSDTISSILKTNPSAKRGRFLDFINGRDKYNFIITSFDKEDCKKYSFLYGKQYIPGGIQLNEKFASYKTDIFFVGKDKGRLPLLRCMENIFKNMNISNEFWILGERRRKYTTEERRHLMQHPVSYETIIQRDQQSKALLEVIQEGQVGLTYRAIEAMMLRKN